MTISPRHAAIFVKKTAAHGLIDRKWGSSLPGGRLLGRLRDPCHCSAGKRPRTTHHRRRWIGRRGVGLVVDGAGRITQRLGVLAPVGFCPRLVVACGDRAEERVVSDQMSHWKRLLEDLQEQADGGVVRRTSPLDLWRLAEVGQVDDRWLQFTMEIDPEHVHSERLQQLGRGRMLVRADVDRMPALRGGDSERGRRDFLAMAMFFLADAAVNTRPDAYVDEVPAYTWPVWIRRSDLAG